MERYALGFICLQGGGLAIYGTATLTNTDVHSNQATTGVRALSALDKGWCDDYYKKCNTDDSGKSCSDKSGSNGFFDTTSDGVCHRRTKSDNYR